MTPRYKKSTKEEAMQKTRTRLLEAAAEEFAREGYDKANINHIAESAGFSIGTIYNYFSSKRDLMLAFINVIAKKHVDFIIDQVELKKDPILRGSLTLRPMIPMPFLESANRSSKTTQDEVRIISWMLFPITSVCLMRQKNLILIGDTSQK